MFETASIIYKHTRLLISYFYILFLYTSLFEEKKELLSFYTPSDIYIRELQLEHYV